MNGFKRGALIVIEGVDRSGKSTQCRKLVESLKSRNVEAALVTFPDRTTTIGGIIDKYLKQEAHVCDEAIHLLFTANRWEKKSEMEKLLKKGVTLVVDRYSYSGIVYSSIKKSEFFSSISRMFLTLTAAKLSFALLHKKRPLFKSCQT